MSNFAKVAISLVVLFFLLVGVGCFSVIGINNDLVSQEESIRAQYKQNQNNHAQMFNKFKEVASVPEMYTEDLKKVYDSAISKRYGNDGSKAMFQWLKEHNPNFDSSLYRQVQQTVEAGRNDFEANQKMLLDKKQQYQSELRQFPTNMVAQFLGFPKIDLDEMDIVINTETEKAFETKKSGPVQLR